MTTMACAGCGAVNDPADSFCTACGRRLDKAPAAAVQAGAPRPAPAARTVPQARRSYSTPFIFLGCLLVAVVSGAAILTVAAATWYWREPLTVYLDEFAAPAAPSTATPTATPAPTPGVSSPPAAPPAANPSPLLASFAGVWIDQDAAPGEVNENSILRLRVEGGRVVGGGGGAVAELRDAGDGRRLVGTMTADGDVVPIEAELSADQERLTLLVKPPASEPYSVNLYRAN